MSTRTWTLLSICLVLAQAFFGVVAADDKTKLGNNTIERTVQLRTHSIYAPYIDQDLQNRWWDFGADAYINTNKHIRLTQNKPHQMGWLWSRLALTASNYVIEVEFKVSGEPTHLFGDGMAMWITKQRTQEGPIFGNQDKFEGLGIMLDTYANARHSYGFPRVIGVQLDGQTEYDWHNDGDSQALGACSVNFRRTNVATKLKVTYVKGSFLDVKIQYKAWDEWTDCFNIPGITLPTNPFIGFTALTGDVSDAHDIISVTSYSAILSPPEAPLNTIKKNKIWQRNPYGTDGVQGSSWFAFLFKLALFAGVCAGGWYGYLEYKRRQDYGGFNFGSGGAGGYALGGGPGSAGIGSAGLGSGGLRSGGYPSPGLSSGGLRSGGFPSPGLGSAGMYANSKRF
ncbi:lectin [Ephemerocybe angulata]|uniref:Lectin n=1 Tax=Ephemerocybe angulata TaxID=980116 RepID=A0A8H6MEL6_9AGAR|nr:lectin [Tulosesus angulatus]